MPFFRSMVVMVAVVTFLRMSKTAVLMAGASDYERMIMPA
jgi:hypothetical protein